MGELGGGIGGGVRGGEGDEKEERGRVLYVRVCVNEYL
jgi:hypothetical protein